MLLVLLVQQERLTHSEVWFSGVRFVESFSFLCSVLSIVVWMFCRFPFAITLSDLFRLMASDDHINTFKAYGCNLQRTEFFLIHACDEYQLSVLSEPVFLF